MSDKINSHICIMLSVYKSFHQTVNYGRQRNHILQDLTGLEIYMSVMASKLENRCETGFQQPKTGINIPNSKYVSRHSSCRDRCYMHLSVDRMGSAPTYATIEICAVVSSL